MVVRKDELTASITDREVISTRVFDAPREILWQAWTDPDHLAEWWGPRGFTNTFHEFDLRPGGAWRFIMHGPSGKDFHNKSVFVEIVKHERIVFEHLEPVHKFQVTAIFAEKAGKTKVTFRMLFETAHECEIVKKYAAPANEQNFDRLEEELASMLTPGGSFEISHVLDAPRDLAWEIWTDCKHLKHWWGPRGFTVRFCKMDLRPGGLFHYCLKGPDGGDMWGKFVFRDIAKPRHIVFVNSFSDQNGGITRHPMSPDWPGEMLSKISFKEQSGKTLVNVKWHPINATAAEQRVFDNGRTSMKQGWSGTFTQLSQYLIQFSKETSSEIR